VVVAAAGLADVLVGDADPAVTLRLRDHALEKLAISLLDVPTVLEDPSHVRDPGQQRVALPFQLSDAQQPRPPGRRDLI
jgi:hypothetical protein